MDNVGVKLDRFGDADTRRYKVEFVGSISAPSDSLRL